MVSAILYGAIRHTSRLILIAAWSLSPVAGRTNGGADRVQPGRTEREAYDRSWPSGVRMALSTTVLGEEPLIRQRLIAAVRDRLTTAGKTATITTLEAVFQGELAKLSAGVYRRASGRTGCETFKFTQNYPCIARYQKRRHPPRAIKPWNLALEARGPGRKTADSVNGGQSMPDLCENTQPISPQDFQNAVFGPTTGQHLVGQVWEFVNAANTLGLVDFDGVELSQISCGPLVFLRPTLPWLRARPIERKIGADGNVILADHIKHIGHGIDDIGHGGVVAGHKSRGEQ